MGALRGYCPFLDRKCKCKDWTCSATNPRKRVNVEDCEDFGNCLKYQEKMVEIRKLL